MDHLIESVSTQYPEAVARHRVLYRALLHKLGRTYDGMTDEALYELAADLLMFLVVRRVWLARRRATTAPAPTHGVQ